MISLFVRSVDKVCDWLAILAGLIIVEIVFSNTLAVIMRYIFNDPLHWPLDISEFSAVGTVFLGGAYTLQRNSHVNISIFLDKFSPRKKAIVSCIIYVLIGVFSFLLVWKSWQLAWMNLYTKSWSITRLPVFPSYIAVPVGSFFLLLQAISKLIKSINEI